MKNGVTLAVVGDLALSGPLARNPLDAVKQMDPGVRDLLRADIVVANLEGGLMDEVPPGRHRNDGLQLSAPTATVEALRWLGVDAVTLANNHILDYGPGGLASTIRALDAAGIRHFGAGMNLIQASEPAVMERGGMRIGLLGFVSAQYPTRNRPGSLFLDHRPSRRLIRQTRQNCDAVVVYFHEGVEALNYPLKSTIRACHLAVECGADLVIGSHPHTIQGIELYREVPIAYGLGNFAVPMLAPDFYERWRIQTGLTLLGIPFEKEVLRRAMVLRATFERGRPVKATGVPIVVDESGLPRLPVGEEAVEAEAFFRRLCDAFHRPEDAVWQERDRIERACKRLWRKSISWGFVLKRLHRLRWRHIRGYLDLLFHR